MAGLPVLIASEIHRHSRYGGKHPLAIARVSTVVDLARALGWLPPGRYVEAACASVDELTRFHDPDYVAAVAEAERTQSATDEMKRRHNLGAGGNPVFGEVFRRPATAVGSALLAAEHVMPGGVAHAPAGGTHHGRRGAASGFCFFNDPVLAILRLLDRGLDRVAYVDIDAHHGDGVQDALSHDPRVLTVSVHEGARWPFTGAADDRGGGQARNLPMPEGFNDDEFMMVLDRAILPLVEGFRPDALVLQCGADALAEDPLSRLALSNRCHLAAVAALRALSPRLIVLGGGGYNPWSVARCWTAVWGTLAGEEMPDRLPTDAEAVLRGLTWHRAAGRNPPDHWLTTLIDEGRRGDVREEVRDVVRRALA